MYRKQTWPCGDVCQAHVWAQGSLGPSLCTECVIWGEAEEADLGFSALGYCGETTVRWVSRVRWGSVERLRGVRCSQCLGRVGTVDPFHCGTHSMDACAIWLRHHLPS